jgi:hypothetical protein
MMMRIIETLALEWQACLFKPGQIFSAVNHGPLYPIAFGLPGVALC